jgi:hypothetical protein
MTLKEALTKKWNCLILLGGEEGTHKFKDCQPRLDALVQQKASGKLCAASKFTPAIVFGSIPGFLQPGATCFPLI